jgi:hypothetical protein
MCGMSDCTAGQRRALAETGRQLEEFLLARGRTFDWFLGELNELGLTDDDVVDEATWAEITRRLGRARPPARCAGRTPRPLSRSRWPSPTDAPR